MFKIPVDGGEPVRLEAALRAGMSSRGIPKVVYLDNGSAMISWIDRPGFNDAYGSWKTICMR